MMKTQQPYQFPPACIHPISSEEIQSISHVPFRHQREHHLGSTLLSNLLLDWNLGCRSTRLAEKTLQMDNSSSGLHQFDFYRCSLGDPEQLGIERMLMDHHGRLII